MLLFNQQSSFYSCQFIRHTVKFSQYPIQMFLPHYRPLKNNIHINYYQIISNLLLLWSLSITVSSGQFITTGLCYFTWRKVLQIPQTRSDHLPRPPCWIPWSYACSLSSVTRCASKSIFVIQNPVIVRDSISNKIRSLCVRLLGLILFWCGF
jgi:hypothetical protein